MDDGILQCIKVELERALALHGEFTSLHECYAVMLEELDEIWDIVKLQTGKRNSTELIKELIQLSAMCAKTIKYIESHKI